MLQEDEKPSSNFQSEAKHLFWETETVQKRKLTPFSTSWYEIRRANFTSRNFKKFNSLMNPVKIKPMNKTT